MRAGRSSLLAWLPSLPLLLVYAQRGASAASAVAPPTPFDGLLVWGSKDADIPGFPEPQSSTASPILSTSTTTSSSPWLEASSSTLLAPTATPISTVLADLVRGRALPSTSSPTPPTLHLSIRSTIHMSTHDRNLVIILSVVLGVLGLVLIGAIIYLTRRYYLSRSNRGATPINDEEIQSWRSMGSEPKHHHSSLDVRIPTLDSIALGHSSRQASYSGRPLIPHTTLPPPSLAKAPNSRVGLTDEAIPGADPFLRSSRSHNGRLSKAPPGHARTKSRRSSISAKSSLSYIGAPGRIQTWYDPDTEKDTRDMDFFSNSPETSVSDGLSSAGGLSPRPKSQLRPWEKEEEIGRAIA